MHAISGPIGKGLHLVGRVIAVPTSSSNQYDLNSSGGGSVLPPQINGLLAKNFSSSYGNIILGTCAKLSFPKNHVLQLS